MTLVQSAFSTTLTRNRLMVRTSCGPSSRLLRRESSRIVTRFCIKSLRTSFEPSLTRDFFWKSWREDGEKVCSYIAQYPVRWTAFKAQTYFSSPGRPVHSDTNSASPGSILAMQQLCNDQSLTCPPLSTARYSLIQLSGLRRREENENAQTSKW